MNTKAKGWGIANRSKPTKRFAEGGAIPEGGRFAESDPDIYERARRFVERGGDSEPAEKPTPAARKPMPARKPVVAVSTPEVDKRSAVDQIPTGGDRPKSLADQIPTGGYPKAPAAMGGGGTERSRNIENTLSALGAVGGLGALARAGRAGSAAAKAVPTTAKTARAAKPPVRAMSPAKKRTSFKDADETGVEYAKGGQVRGWGKARGGRSAKII